MPPILKSLEIKSVKNISILKLLNNINEVGNFILKHFKIKLCTNSKEIEKLLKYKILPLKEIEIVNIYNAMGRFLAENIYAKIDIPPANNSAVDGYLFRHKSITSEPVSKNFNVVQEIHGVKIFTKIVPNISVIKVSTGSHIPNGLML